VLMLFTRDQATRETSRLNRDKLPDRSGIRLMTREQRACYAVCVAKLYEKKRVAYEY